MNYIVFDLEWNQCPYGKERENKKLPFEIIEIGAVKLNEHRKVIDEFHEVIKPVIYRRLHFCTKKIVHITNEEMQKSRVFPEVAEDFLLWCGSDAVFVTWGTLDLTELQRNLRYYYMEEMLPGPIYYYDAQKLYAIASGNRKDRKSLQIAADEQNIKVEGDFHMALADARYTAAMFAGIDGEVICANRSIDCFQNPKTEEDEITIVYDNYVKFISREFDTKEALMSDREVASMRCIDCGRRTAGRIRWFSTNSAKTHIAVGECKEHGLMKGKIRVKKSTSSKFYCIKTQKHITKSEYDVINDKQKSIRRRRHDKKRNNKI